MPYHFLRARYKLKCFTFLQNLFILLDEYDKRCGAGWVYDPSGSFNCFYFNEQRHRTWFDARGFCKEIDITSDILTINNAQEQAFIAGQIVSKPLTTSFWIGATDQNMDSGWMWRDGEIAFKYVNWADGKHVLFLKTTKNNTGSYTYV